MRTTGTSCYSEPREGINTTYRVLKGEILLQISQIQLKDGKIFWLAVFDIEQEQHALKPNVIAEASLSLEYPITIKIGSNRMTIGTKEAFLYRRLAIQAARKRAMAESAHSRGVTVASANLKP